jgi:hypothetical protein
MMLLLPLVWCVRLVGQYVVVNLVQIQLVIPASILD